jgi:hypothetical protein
MSAQLVTQDLHGLNARAAAQPLPQKRFVTLPLNSLDGLTKIQVIAYFGQCNYTDTIVSDGDLGHIKFVYTAMEGFHRTQEFYQNILGKIQTYFLTVEPCASLIASQTPVTFADVRIEYDIESDGDARFRLPIPMEFEALLHFPMPKMAVQPGKEDNGLFATVYVVYDLNIGCPYEYQLMPEVETTSEPPIEDAPTLIAAPVVVEVPALITAPTVEATPAPPVPDPTPEPAPEEPASTHQPHLTDAEAIALATLRQIDAGFDSAPGSETASRLACMLQVYRSMSRSVHSRLGPLPTPQPQMLIAQPSRNPVMPPLMLLPTNLPNVLLRQFSSTSQPKKKKKPHRGPRKPKYLQTQRNIPVWNYQ